MTEKMHRNVTINLTKIIFRYIFKNFNTLLAFHSFSVKNDKQPTVPHSRFDLVSKKLLLFLFPDIVLYQYFRNSCLIIELKGGCSLKNFIPLLMKSSKLIIS